MNKQEFLRILRQSLDGEIDSNTIEQNIRYYDDYIASKGIENEQRILAELGDPRLIAKSIIDANKNSNMKGVNYKKSSQYHASNSFGDTEEDTAQNIHCKVLWPLKWYHKLIGILVLIALAFLLIFVSKVVLSIIFTFGLPILIIALIVMLLKGRR